MPTFTISRTPYANAVEFPAAELCFGADGGVAGADPVSAIRTEFGEAGVTDLLVLCGGWSDRDSEMRSLYDGLSATIRNAARRDPAFAAHTYGVLRIIWPAKRWPESLAPLPPEELTAEERGYREIASLEMQVTALRGAFSGHQADRHLLKVWQLISTVKESIPAQVSLVEHVRELVRGTDEMNPSPKPDEYASRRFLNIHPIRLLEAVSTPIDASAMGRSSSPGIGEDMEDDSETPLHLAHCDVYQGIRNLLKYAMASEMRARSEAVGRRGLRDSLLDLSRGLPQTRFHLIGHSFGARAVLTAVDAPAESSKLLRPKSITLLQPSLSENALSAAAEDSPEGYFHSVLAEGKAGGPILVSHAMSDETAGIPYAIACSIAKHSQPGKHAYPDPVRSMGQVGATRVGALDLPASGRITHRWKRGMVANFNGYGLIENHSDVCKLEIARTILSAATTTT